MALLGYQANRITEKIVQLDDDGAEKEEKFKTKVRNEEKISQ